jgi:hypothetical protein
MEKLAWATKNIDFIRQQNLSGLVKNFSGTAELHSMTCTLPITDYSRCSKFKIYSMLSVTASY